MAYPGVTAAECCSATFSQLGRGGDEEPLRGDLFLAKFFFPSREMKLAMVQFDDYQRLFAYFGKCASIDIWYFKRIHGILANRPMALWKEHASGSANRAAVVLGWGFWNEAILGVKIPTGHCVSQVDH